VGVYPRTPFQDRERECGSSDIFRLARIALEAMIRSESDLAELFRPDVADRLLGNTL
jgi:hypothetical protein